MRKVIVTGADGFVGTALCRNLSEKGIKVIAVVRNNKSDMIFPGLRTVRCDMSDYRYLDNAIKDRDIDVFYHLAWAGTSGALRGDSSLQLDNVRYTLDAVRAAEKMKVEKFVFASSIMEHEVEALMKTEAAPGISCMYSTAKVTADYMTRTLSEKLGIEYVSALISNVYGPGENSPRLINTTLRKLISGERCSFTSGEQMYDFIYIDDAAEAFVKVGEKGKKNRLYYIGSGEPRPLREFLLAMRDEVNPVLDIGLGELPSPAVSLAYTEFDTTALERDTGFIPSVSFEDGIRRTVCWLKEKR